MVIRSTFEEEWPAATFGGFVCSAFPRAAVPTWALVEIACALFVPGHVEIEGPPATRHHGGSAIIRRRRLARSRPFNARLGDGGPGLSRLLYRPAQRAAIGVGTPGALTSAESPLSASTGVNLTFG